MEKVCISEELLREIKETLKFVTVSALSTSMNEYKPDLNQVQQSGRYASACLKQLKSVS
jgi:hypothetical protein